MGPSHDGLSCRNIHCGERTELFRNICSGSVCSTGVGVGWRGMLPGYLFQSCVHVHLHLHDKQVRGLDDLLHHLGSATQDGC